VPKGLWVQIPPSAPFYSQKPEGKIEKKQLIVAWIIGILAISGVILAGSRFYHYRNDGMSGKTIIVRAGKEFAIRLGSNGTTGYQWQLAEPVDENMIRFMRSEYITPDTDLMGAPGVENWTFMALKTGKSKVTLKYVRPWEKDIPPVDRKEFVIVIR
jgi:predicted secreted protein